MFLSSQLTLEDLREGVADLSRQYAGIRGVSRDGEREYLELQLRLLDAAMQLSDEWHAKQMEREREKIEIRASLTQSGTRSVALDSFAVLRGEQGESDD